MKAKAFKIFLPSALLLLLLAPSMMEGAFALPLEKPPGFLEQEPLASMQQLSLHGVTLPIGATVDEGSVYTPSGRVPLWFLRIFGPALHDFTIGFFFSLPYLVFASLSTCLLFLVFKYRRCNLLKFFRAYSIAILLVLSFCASTSLLDSAKVEATTPALDTGVIAVLAYYKPASSLTLNKTLTAYINYTWGGNYIDGYVRVWQSATIGPTSGIAIDGYVDIPVRVRADGWVLTWILRVHREAPSGTTRCFLFYLGTGISNPGAVLYYNINFPPVNMTTMSRAMEIIATAHGALSFNRNNVKYYDYELTQSTRMFMFGKDGSGYWYVTIPYGVTVDKVYAIHTAHYSSSGGFSIDGITINTHDAQYHLSSNRRPGDNPHSCNFFDITSEASSWQPGTQHTIYSTSSNDDLALIMFSH